MVPLVTRERRAMLDFHMMGVGGCRLGLTATESYVTPRTYTIYISCPETTSARSCLVGKAGMPVSPWPATDRWMQSISHGPRLIKRTGQEFSRLCISSTIYGASPGRVLSLVILTTTDSRYKHEAVLLMTIDATAGTEWKASVRRRRKLMPSWRRSPVRGSEDALALKSTTDDIAEDISWPRSRNNAFLIVPLPSTLFENTYCIDP